MTFGFQPSSVWISPSSWDCCLAVKRLRAAPKIEKEKSVTSSRFWQFDFQQDTGFAISGVVNWGNLVRLDNQPGNSEVKHNRAMPPSRPTSEHMPLHGHDNGLFRCDQLLRDHSASRVLRNVYFQVISAAAVLSPCRLSQIICMGSIAALVSS